MVFGVRRNKLGCAGESVLKMIASLRLAWTGFKRSLTAQDLWHLPPQYKASHIVQGFLAHLQKTTDRIRAKNTKDETGKKRLVGGLRKGKRFHFYTFSNTCRPARFRPSSSLLDPNTCWGPP